MTDTRTALAPCPFCGSTSAPMIWDSEDAAGESWDDSNDLCYQVVCDASNPNGRGGCGGAGGFCATVDEAIDAWQARAALAALAQPEPPQSVPREATLPMLEAYARVVNAGSDLDGAMIWRCMLAAAPPPPAQPEQCKDEAECMNMPWCRIKGKCLKAEPAAAPPPAPAQPAEWRDHVEQRMHSWKQRIMNRSGDHLALDDFMDKESLDDLIDYVCDEWAGPQVATDCGEAGHAEGRCGNASRIASAPPPPPPPPPPAQPVWCDKGRAMMALNSVVALLGGDNGPTLQLREFIEKL